MGKRGHDGTVDLSPQFVTVFQLNGIDACGLGTSSFPHLLFRLDLCAAGEGIRIGLRSWSHIVGLPTKIVDYRGTFMNRLSVVMAFVDDAHWKPRPCRCCPDADADVSMPACTILAFITRSDTTETGARGGHGVSTVPRAGELHGCMRWNFERPKRKKAANNSLDETVTVWFATCEGREAREGYCPPVPLRWKLGQYVLSPSRPTSMWHGRQSRTGGSAPFLAGGPDSTGLQRGRQSVTAD